MKQIIRIPNTVCRILCRRSKNKSLVHLERFKQFGLTLLGSQSALEAMEVNWYHKRRAPDDVQDAVINRATGPVASSVPPGPRSSNTGTGDPSIQVVATYKPCEPASPELREGSNATEEKGEYRASELMSKTVELHFQYQDAMEKPAHLPILTSAGRLGGMLLALPLALLHC